MTTPRSLSLDSIVDVVVEISPLAAPRATFNQLLIVGSTDIIDTDERLRLYTSADTMLDDGFALTDPEYIAAQIYFSQSPAPNYVWIGRQDLSASPAETPLEALVACRAANFEWYTCVALNAVKADHLLIAAWVEAAQPSSIYGFTTWDADVPTADALNIFEMLKALNYTRTIGQYATTQIASPIPYPNNIYAIVAIFGYAMGQNTGLANSAFTLKFKEEVGIAIEPLTATQVSNIEGNNGNIYLSYGNYYTIFEQGKMSDGSFFDEKINLDMLVNNLQLTVMDMLYGNPKIPQTDPGEAMLIHACNEACDQAVLVGFLAPGIWTGRPILALNTDDPLPKGYLCQASPYAEQSRADREARKAMPIYIAIKEAGAVHSIVIGVYVNR